MRERHERGRERGRKWERVAPLTYLTLHIRRTLPLSPFLIFLTIRASERAYTFPEPFFAELPRLCNAARLHLPIYISLRLTATAPRFSLLAPLVSGSRYGCTPDSLKRQFLTSIFWRMFVNIFWFWTLALQFDGNYCFYLQ